MDDHRKDEVGLAPAARQELTEALRAVGVSEVKAVPTTEALPEKSISDLPEDRTNLFAILLPENFHTNPEWMWHIRDALKPIEKEFGIRFLILGPGVQIFRIERGSKSPSGERNTEEEPRRSGAG